MFQPQCPRPARRVACLRIKRAGRPHRANYAGHVGEREVEVIDSELRLLAAGRRAVRDAAGPPPSIGPV